MNIINLSEFTESKVLGSDFESGTSFIGLIGSGQKLYMRSQSKIIDLENGNEFPLETSFDTTKIVTILITTENTISKRVSQAVSNG